MTDQMILDEFFDSEKGKCIASKLNKKWLSEHPEYKEYMDTRFPEPFEKYPEVISRIYNKIEEKPVCCMCGKPLKYRSFFTPYKKWCGQKCQLTDPEFIRWRESKIDKKESWKKARQTCLEKYGDEHYSNREKFKQTCLEKYGADSPLGSKEIRKKINKTVIEKYGVDNVSKAPEIIQKIYDVKLEKYGDGYYNNYEKGKQTMLERYGVENYMLTDNFIDIRESNEVREKIKIGVQKSYIENHDSIIEKQKQTWLKHFNVDNPHKLKEVIQKVNNTKAKNHTFNTSKIEEQVKEYLDEHNIEYRAQYKSDKYPFVCDFYFPQNDVYFEIQGMWTHGKKPFTGSEEDLEKLEKWKAKDKEFYKNAIYNWTVRDVEKRRIAKENNINLVEVFSIKFDEVIQKIQEVIA